MISKQILVIRKDLNMRKGKIVAQAAHASLKVILDNMKFIESAGHLKTKGEEGREVGYLKLEAKTAIHDWINGRFTKICVSVDSEKELFEIYNAAKEKRLLTSLILDAGLTEFGGVPTYTCCAIGPNWDEEIDPITKHLKLL